MTEILTKKSKFTQAEKIIHDQFVAYGRNAREWTRKCALLLPKIAANGLWRKKGFSSIYEYAAKLAGMNHKQVTDALWVLKKAEDKPELMKVIEEKGLGAVKPIVTIATSETAEFWAEKARTMSKNTLETYVREFKSQNNESQNNENRNDLFKSQNDIFGFPRKSDNAEIPQQKAVLDLNLFMESQKPCILQKKVVAIELEPEILQQLEKLKGKNSWNDLMKQLLQLREEQLEEQKRKIQKQETQKPATSTRHIPAKIKRFVLNRTNGQCAFPGCIKPSNILHHTQRWALQKIHDPNQLFGLCKAHERIAHLGLIQNEDQKPQNWSVRKEADKLSAKYRVDEIVQRFRLAG